MFEGKVNPNESTSRKILRDDLDDFLSEPVTPAEVQTKADFYARVQPWLSNALIVAGYPLKEIDERIKMVFERKDFFNRDAESVAADVNRIINNWVVEARTLAPAVDATELLKSSPFVPKEQIIRSDDEANPQADTAISELVQNQAEVSPFAKKVEPFRSPDDAEPNQVVINTRMPDVSSVSSIEIKHEEENLPLATEFDEREAEYAEYGNRTVTPTRIVPQFTETLVQSVGELPGQSGEVTPMEPLVLENPLPEPLVLTEAHRVADPLVLTPEMRVAEANEPIVLETVELGGVETTEVSDVASEYQSKLDALNEQPFNHDKYFELAYGIFSASRDAYDAVLQNPKLYTQKIFAPSENEKAAILLRGRMQKHYSRMRFLRQDVTECLESDPDTLNEAEIKFLIAKFISHSEKLIQEAGELTNLYEVIKTEEKPSVAEVYRAQFEKMQTEGNQVLQSLPTNHPLYDRLKSAIKVDLKIIIEEASIEKGGDKAVLENSSNFMARRDQIKNLIGFLKDEQQYQDFFDRARVRIKKLESQYQNIEVTESTQGVKQSLAENIERIKQVLGETAPQVATVGVLDSLRTKKDTIQGLLLESAELLTSLPIQEIVSQELTGANVLSDEEVMARIESSKRGKEIVDAQERYKERAELVRFFPQWAEAVRQRELRALESGANLERNKDISAKFPLGKIGKAAVIALAAYFGSAEKVNQASNTMLESSMISGLGTTSPALDQNAISEYLRTVVTENPFETTSIVVTELAQAPEVNEVAPILNAAPMVEEAVPGVMLPNMVNTQNSEAYDQPLKIFSNKADRVSSDRGIILESPKKSDGFENLRQPYKINFGDKFWDINEGQTLAGKLPVMSQINPFFKQALIDRMRDKINSDQTLRTAIGGFGANADQLRTGELMNLDKLNELGINVAIEYGYLK